MSLSTRGYFAIGVEGVTKPRNLGALMRSAHGFGAAFVFTLEARFTKAELYKSDTSKTLDTVPLYQFDGLNSLRLPERCALVGVELCDQAVDLPSFRHPLRAAYVLGPEKGSLSEPLLEQCDHVVKIPTRFCINVATAGAIMMYDRVLSFGRFAERPVSAGGPKVALEPHKHGGVFSRRSKVKPQQK